MGKHFGGEDDDRQLQSNHPGCMWGIFHALDYHHWNYLKKILPHRKHNGPRLVKGRRARATIDVYDPKEVRKQLDDEPSHFDDNKITTKTSTSNKRSLIARIKALIFEEISKEATRRKRASGYPAKRRLHRTHSIHHLEPSDLGPHGKSTILSHPVIFLRGKKPIASKGKYNKENKRLADEHTYCHKKFQEEKETSGNKEHLDVLELLKVNKDSFLELLQNEDEEIANCFRSLQDSNMGARLTKSSSFPLADSSRCRSFRPSKLKNKQYEVWSFPKGEKLYSGTQTPKLVNSKFPKDNLSRPGQSDNGGSKQKNEDEFSSQDSAQGLNKQGIVEVGEQEECSSSYHESDVYVHALRKVIRKHMRTSSLNESLERYSQLFENSFGKEVNLHLSKSLKLMNEYKIPSNEHALKSFRRVRSLDSYSSIYNGTYRDSHFLGIHNRKSVDISKNLETIEANQEDLTEVEEIENLTNEVEKSDSRSKEGIILSLGVSTDGQSTVKMFGLVNEREEQKREDSNMDKEMEITLEEASSNNLPEPSPISVVQSCFQGDVTSPADFQIPEGVVCRSDYVDKKESENESYSSSGSFSRSSAHPDNFKIETSSVDDSKPIELFTNSNAEFRYVRDILERSGFMGNDFLEPWHSPDGPLNPRVFEEADACWPHEPHCNGPYGEEICSCLDHQLLFDLTNEVLLQILDCSSLYYPRPLSSNCHVRPLPVGCHVPEEISGRISKAFSLRPEADQTLDSIVGQDLWKDDRWMNLQLESECIALELEDLIFDELLEELLSA
ncbi:hypothetical protein NMG60_11014601 [Bertholletia excelsa]